LNSRACYPAFCWRCAAFAFAFSLPHLLFLVFLQVGTISAAAKVGSSTPGTAGVGSVTATTATTKPAETGSQPPQQQVALVALTCSSYFAHGGPACTVKLPDGRVLRDPDPAAQQTSFAVAISTPRDGSSSKQTRADVRTRGGLNNAAAKPVPAAVPATVVLAAHVFHDSSIAAARVADSTSSGDGGALLMAVQKWQLRGDQHLWLLRPTVVQISPQTGAPGTCLRICILCFPYLLTSSDRRGRGGVLCAGTLSGGICGEWQLACPNLSRAHRL
jgi:hypothetical protein